MPLRLVLTIPRCRAFTLIEILVVLGIVGVLCGLVLHLGHRTAETARIARAKAELVSLAASLESYRRAYGDYPQTADPQVLLQSLIGRRGPTGALIDARAVVEIAHLYTADGLDPFTDTTAQCVDPWGQPYRYYYKSSSPWTQPGFVLFSCGLDGAHAEPLNGGRIDESAQANGDNLYANR